MKLVVISASAIRYKITVTSRQGRCRDPPGTWIYFYTNLSWFLWIYFYLYAVGWGASGIRTITYSIKVKFTTKNISWEAPEGLKPRKISSKRQSVTEDPKLPDIPELEDPRWQIGLACPFSWDHQPLHRHWRSWWSQRTSESNKTQERLIRLDSNEIFLVSYGSGFIYFTFLIVGTHGSSSRRKVK